LNKALNIQRYPSTSNRSLKAWSAADEHILKLVENEIKTNSTVTIINDRFGFLTLNVVANSPCIISHFKSQEEAIIHNYDLNNKASDKISFSKLLDLDDKKYDFTFLKIPKSMDLFHLFMIKAHQLSNSDSKVFCGFMTRHFTKQMLEIASLYFENIDQSLAWKKSRVLILSSPKDQVPDIKPVHDIAFINHREKHLLFKQYYGVFSAKHIDYATQFLLQHLEVDESVQTALDLASGNGVIAHEIRSQSQMVEVHLLDDSYLAIESSKLNIAAGNNHFHYDYKLDKFADQYFDLIVCNPPFHFEHENTIDIALQLFEGAFRILNSNGSFVLVSNLHLNYKTHLSKIFSSVKVIGLNSKFEVIRCRKNNNTF